MPSVAASILQLEASLWVEFFDYPTHTVGNLIDDRGKILLRAMCPRALAPPAERHDLLDRWFCAVLNHAPLPVECMSLRE